MNRIQKIKEQLDVYENAPRSDEKTSLWQEIADDAPKNIRYLLAKLEIAEKTLEEIYLTNPRLEVDGKPPTYRLREKAGESLKAIRE